MDIASLAKMVNWTALTREGAGAAFMVAFLIAVYVLKGVATQLTESLVSNQKFLTLIMEELQATVRENTESNRDMIQMIAEIRGILSVTAGRSHDQEGE